MKKLFVLALLLSGCGGQKPCTDDIGCSTTQVCIQFPGEQGVCQPKCGAPDSCAYLGRSFTCVLAPKSDQTEAFVCEE